MRVESIQPQTEDTYWMEFLKTKGEDIQHVGFLVDDIDEAETELLKKGGKIIYRSRVTKGHGSAGGGAYFDTVKIGRVLFEVIQRTPI